VTRAHLEAEIGRLRIGAADMDHAAGGAGFLAAIREGQTGRINGDADEALMTGVVVSYARPFTRRQGIGALDEGAWAPDDDAQRRLHRALILLRNRRYAHTDKTDLRGIEDVFGDGSYSEWSVGIADDAWARIAELASAQALRMRDLAGRLEDTLRSVGGD
jgi:hypothetical protein